MKNKRAKIFFIVSSVIFLISIVTLYYYLNDVDEKYTQLINREAKTFDLLQHLTYESNRNYSLLTELLLAKSETEIDSLLKKRISFINDTNSLVDSLSSFSIYYSLSKSHINTLIETRTMYQSKVNDFVSMIKTGQKDKAYLFLRTEVQSGFGNYQSALREYFVHHKFQFISRGDKLSDEVQTRSALVLLLGVSPLIVLTGFILFGLLLLGVLLWIFRGTEQDF